MEEIVLQRHVGLLIATEMFELLAALESWVPRVVDPVDGVLPGSSEEDVEALLADGFISEAEADRILDFHRDADGVRQRQAHNR
ncbi:hypothetical protein [Promicromonospora umidemergens]|uniref:hypothetical protein n=1 Tax=Promicromonospora umidemergens TaxID=629679 RepID=UPI0020A434B2|nr:hypothetical protein [Promicromonospora umidemergens]